VIHLRTAQSYSIAREWAGLEAQKTKINENPVSGVVDTCHVLALLRVRRDAMQCHLYARMHPHMHMHMRTSM